MEQVEKVSCPIRGVLEDVIYQIFESDAEWLDENSSQQTFHSIDREIVLVVDAERVYVSWILDKDVDSFVLATTASSLNKYPPQVVRSMADNDLWRDLVGRAVTIEYMNNDARILSIKADEECVYVCAYDYSKDSWWSDTLFIGKIVPAGS